MTGQTVRAFVAIEIPLYVQESLAEIQETLEHKIACRSVRWVSPQGIHLTLSFLGEITSEQASKLMPRLSGIARMSNPFRLSIGRLGCFPRPRKPRVIWAGVLGDLVQLHDIQDLIQRCLADMGHKREKLKFSPHLTLGRVRRTACHRDLNAIDKYVRIAWFKSVCEWSVAEVSLVKSNLSPSGAVYSTLSQFPLKRLCD